MRGRSASSRSSSSASAASCSNIGSEGTGRAGSYRARLALKVERTVDTPAGTGWEPMLARDGGMNVPNIGQGPGSVSSAPAGSRAARPPRPAPTRSRPVAHGVIGTGVASPGWRGSTSTATGSIDPRSAAAGGDATLLVPDARGRPADVLARTRTRMTAPTGAATASDATGRDAGAPARGTAAQANRGRRRVPALRPAQPAAGHRRADAVRPRATDRLRSPRLAAAGVAPVAAPGRSWRAIDRRRVARRLSAR